MLHRNRLVNNSAIIRTTAFPSSSRKSSLLCRAYAREASFRGSHRVPQHHAPCLSPGRNIPPTHFLRFSPVVMPVKVVRRFHHQRRLRLTTSGGTFS
ncbi:hypothetical protein FAX15_21525 [Escherichia coli]|uniref:Uncharacterized protein n=1 Tax=Citrobacter rodentium TaxID=67825 RepID=A0A482PVY4_CITRO|nr:hypothetical protein E2R62_21655 [Citrobacter rodentium]TLD74645.1 hypothetical protein FAX15_21525 [Escherichia coli]HAT8012339.1 hypothetical protein [Citrobacter rodentium NBRC 105723 = DSM 16636]HAT8017390.1 hypothetical protein [Citrobacter rodentium]HAT8027093.1 hypothetical protein [Citrobacter rodentium]